ncbi:MAG: Ldh family oxidoreductase [Williamsia sp.]|nr:Ldh family oxidoreductase [Williamsia sp.]
MRIPYNELKGECKRVLLGLSFTEERAESGHETGLSQFFLCLHQPRYEAALIEEILAYTRSSARVRQEDEILYPGEHTLRTRKKNQAEGIPVHPDIWNELLRL